MMSKKIFLDFFFTFSKIDNWEQKNLIWYNISSAFISLIVKQFKFYVSCVSLLPVQPHRGARYLVNGLVPMNVRTMPALPENQFSQNQVEWKKMLIYWCFMMSVFVCLFGQCCSHRKMTVNCILFCVNNISFYQSVFFLTCTSHVTSLSVDVVLPSNGTASTSLILRCNIVC